MEFRISPDMNPVEGLVINIDKPMGWTSTDVVRKVKFAFNKAGYKKIKVGHAGTLDPLATGVLLVCVGRATKSVEELQAQPKQYITDIMLGATTPSFDLEHPVDMTYPYEHITREAVEKAAAELCGERIQIPPVYSAKKIEGMRAYDYAREGTEIRMKGALVNIYGIEILEYDLPRLRLKIDCSKGTYIRSIASEIGEKLNSGAHLTYLRRTASGSFTADDAFDIDDVIKNIGQMKQN